MTRTEAAIIVGDKRPGYLAMAEAVRNYHTNLGIARQYAHEPVTRDIYLACANGCLAKIPVEIWRRNGVKLVHP